MDGSLCTLAHTVEDAVDSLRGEWTVGGIARNVCLINLKTRTGQVLDLLREHVGHPHQEFFEVPVVLVEERSREHIRTGNREFERPSCNRAGPLAIA